MSTGVELECRASRVHIKNAAAEILLLRVNVNVNVLSSPLEAAQVV